jgi:hypothetical protein
VNHVKSPSSILLAIALTCLICQATHAVKPGRWQHSTEASFSKGTTERMLITSQGHLTLRRALATVAQLSKKDGIVYDIEQLSDGAICLAIGPRGKLGRVGPNQKQAQIVADFGSEQTFALARSTEGLWVAVSSSHSRLELRTGDALAVKRTIELPDVRYVWDILIDGPTLYLATGNKGRVYRVAADGNSKPQIILESQQPNVLCLGMDKAKRLFAGTDGDGLIFRLTPAVGGAFESFVLYDAREPEIGALYVQDDGTVYAGTADANQARRGRLKGPTKAAVSRPDNKAKPKEPTVPKTPDPPAKAAPILPGAPPQAGGPKPKPMGAAAKPAAANASAKAPAPANRVRQIAQRLAVPKAAPAPGVRRTSTTSTRRPTTTAIRGGNAIYRINPAGFVREIFRETVMVLRLLPTKDGLLITTGNEGQIYHLRLSDGRLSPLAKLDANQIPAAMADPKGGWILGTANPGRLLRLQQPFAKSGVFTSPPMDAKQVSVWGKMQCRGQAPTGSSLKLQTRSGNVADPKSGHWSKWQDVGSGGKIALTQGLSEFLAVASPHARFLQYRFLFESDGKQSPNVSAVSVGFLVPNLEPILKTVRGRYVAPKPSSPAVAGPKPLTMMRIDWDAMDPNGDKMIFDLEARPVGKPAGAGVRIGSKITTKSFTWDTRTMPDGRYEIRLTASDLPDNLPDRALSRSHLSSPILIDNTPPTLKNISGKAVGADGYQLTLTAHDAHVPIVEVRYRMDADKQWHFVLCNDLIYDSTSEDITIKLSGLSKGSHVVTVRAVDGLGNARYVNHPIVVTK